MKNVLIYSLFAQGNQEVCQLQAAKDHIKNGDNVMFLTCSRTCGCCSENCLVDQTQCKVCTYYQIKRARKYLGDSANICQLDNYLTDSIIKESNAYEFIYNMFQSLENLNTTELKLDMVRCHHIFHGLETWIPS